MSIDRIFIEGHGGRKEFTDQIEAFMISSNQVYFPGEGRNVFRLDDLNIQVRIPVNVGLPRYFNIKVSEAVSEVLL